MAAIFTDDNFAEEVLDSKIPVLVDFFAVWCGPCQAIAPVLEKLAKEFDGKVKIGKMDVDQNPQTPAKYGVRGIPNLIIIKDGEVVEQLVGALPEEELRAKIESQIET